MRKTRPHSTREVDWVIGELKRKVRRAEGHMNKPWWNHVLALGA